MSSKILVVLSISLIMAGTAIAHEDCEKKDDATPAVHHHKERSGVKKKAHAVRHHEEHSAAKEKEEKAAPESLTEGKEVTDAEHHHAEQK